MAFNLYRVSENPVDDGAFLGAFPTRAKAAAFAKAEKVNCRIVSSAPRAPKIGPKPEEE